MAYENKDEAKGDPIVAELTGVSPRKLILVFAPPYDLGLSQGDNAEIPRIERSSLEGPALGGPDRGAGGPQAGTGRTFMGSGTFSSRRVALNVEDMWIDVGFRISPQGRVQDLEVLRSKGSRSWARPLLKSIARRRYTPAKADSPASVRRERYTFTSGLEAGSGSKAKQHSPHARVEYFDLSDVQSTE